MLSLRQFLTKISAIYTIEAFLMCDTRLPTSSNETKKFDYAVDVVISGFGPAALATALEALSLGKTVLIISDRREDFVRVQCVHINNSNKLYLLNMLKKEQDMSLKQLEDDTKFINILLTQPGVAIKDLEGFIKRRLETYSGMSYCYESSISDIDMPNGIVSVAGVKIKFTYFIAADGAKHHSANILNKSSPKPLLDYKTEYEDKNHTHASFYAVIQRADKKELNIPDQSFIGIVDDSGNNLCYVWFNTDSYKKSDFKKIKCNFAAEIPFSIKDAEELKVYFQELLNKDFEERGIDNESVPLIVEVTPKSKKHKEPKDKMKVQFFQVKMDVLDQPALVINNHYFLSVGDAKATPIYHLGHGLNGALINAQWIRDIFQGTKTPEQYNSLCRKQVKTFLSDFSHLNFNKKTGRAAWVKQFSELLQDEQKEIEEYRHAKKRR